MSKDKYIIIKELVEKFENSDNIDVKNDVKHKLEPLSHHIDDMLCKCEDHFMVLALKARQIVDYDKISVKSP